MRVLLFGLLVAGLWWWWSGSWSGEAEAGVAPGTPATAETPGLERMLQRAEPPPSPASAVLPDRTPAPPLDASGAAVPVAGPGVAELLPALARRDPAAIDAGWIAVVGATGDDRRALVAALAPAGGDFPSLLAGLGSHNAFLHSPEGRGLAARAAAAMASMPDAEAVDAGSRLVGLMVRGRIRREDEAARLLVDETYRQHRVRVDRWLCDPANVAGARSYTVVAGDSLARIASRFRKEQILVEDGTLALLNRIHNPNSLQVGQKLKVPVAPIRAVVEKRSFALTIHVGEQLLRLYWVGHGEHDRTPVTQFTVGDKQPRPDWTAPDGHVYPYGHPKNILGEYFVKFVHDSYVGFGAHGTPMPETIATMSSMGCVRMLAPDIDELFRLLPRGAKVDVRATESLP